VPAGQPLSWYPRLGAKGEDAQPSEVVLEAGLDHLEGREEVDSAGKIKVFPMSINQSFTPPSYCTVQYVYRLYTYI
jgi:hypothetical protein